ncbi:MAG: DUF1864 family protein [Hellea sp.]|nr:DUF1864 family protein [Hellea sp.]
MSQAVEDFDHWIRTEFVELNTALEEQYFAQEYPGNVVGVGDKIKGKLESRGRELIAPLIAEGNTERQFDKAFDVLGNLGLFLAALRRHELTNPDREARSPYDDCSALGMHIAASMGVVPRFVMAHLSTHNRAIGGKPKSFTSLPDEQLFNHKNHLAVMAFKRAGSALMKISKIGISSPVAMELLSNAKKALEEVAVHNKQLFDNLDVDRFYFSVRPYFKPYRVGRNVYRGANAGDFAEINQIDLLLGLCRGNDPYYAQILEEKILYMVPDDQVSLKQCLGTAPLLDEIVALAPKFKNKDWFISLCALYLEVCKAHGRTAVQHHNMLVEKFINGPSKSVPEPDLKQVTASGPPLEELINALEHLRDLRVAAPNVDYHTAHAELDFLRSLLK